MLKVARARQSFSFREEMKEGRGFDQTIPECPLLPGVSGILRVEDVRAKNTSRGTEFYYLSLEYAHSLWREGKPAQAILQLNRAWMADLHGDEGVLEDWPPPYAPLVWIMDHAPQGAFLGNPVRHFQHLATRISGPRAEQRSWRAWACFLLAQRMLPCAEFPADTRQIESERLVLPELREVSRALERLGWQGEAAEFGRVMANLQT